MTDQFTDRARLLRTLARASLECVDDESGRRYCSGFIFGVEAAEEVGEFTPYPEPLRPFMAMDPFIRGMFEGRAGDASQFRKARFKA